MIAAEAARESEDAIELTPDDLTAWGLFIAASGQWRWHPAANMRLGLDYPALQAVASMMGEAIDASTFRRIQLIEAGALDEFVRQAQRRAR